MLINRIRELRVEYKEKPKEYYCSLDEYILMAKKSIAKFASPLAKGLLRNDDFISEIAHSIMMADWRWNGLGDRVGYRSKCANWAIKVNLRKLKKNTDLKILSLNYDINYDNGNDNVGLYNIIEDKRLNNYPKSINTEAIFEKSGLTDKQKQLLIMYYIDGMKLREIAEQVGTTPQNINKIIRTSVKKIKKYNTKEKIYGDTK
jgi:RNA polymerase sigma factor (sigma-70 family)